MIELVIEAPHLQTRGQRIGTHGMLAAGWCLWAYFSLPFFELCGWALGLPFCSLWVNLSGGYLNLQHLLAVYAGTIALLLGSWSLWALYNGWQQKRRRSTQSWPRAESAELCRAFEVSEEDRTRALAGSVVTVEFDGAGRIVSLSCSDAAPEKLPQPVMPAAEAERREDSAKIFDFPAVARNVPSPGPERLGARVPGAPIRLFQPVTAAWPKAGSENVPFGVDFSASRILQTNVPIEVRGLRSEAADAGAKRDPWDQLQELAESVCISGDFPAKPDPECSPGGRAVYGAGTTRHAFGADSETLGIAG